MKSKKQYDYEIGKAIQKAPSTSFPCVPDLADTCIFRHFSAFQILALLTFSFLGINSVSRLTSQSLAKPHKKKMRSAKRTPLSAVRKLTL